MEKIMNNIHFLSEIIIKEYFPESMTSLENTWPILKKFLVDSWHINPRKWSSPVAGIRKAGEPSPNLVPAIIVMTIAAILYEFNKKTTLLSADKEEVQKLVQSYAKHFGVPKELSSHLVKVISMIFKSKFLINGIPSKAKAKYRIITHEEPHYKEVSEQELNNIKKDPNILFVDQRTIYFKRKIWHLRQDSVVDFLKILGRSPNQFFPYRELAKLIFKEENKNTIRKVYKIKYYLVHLKNLPELANNIDTYYRDGCCLVINKNDQESLKYCICLGVTLAPENEG